MTILLTKIRQKEILIGVGILSLTLIVLLLLAILLPQDPTASSSNTPDDPENTLIANPYGPEDFVYEGDYLTCLAGESILGIDVSYHQQQIDWEAVARAGIRFVMIRVGYRGYKTGDLNVDIMAQENYLGAKKAGLKIGAYFFSQATNVEEAQAEAAFALNIIKDWKLDMPFVYDWEYLSEEARTADTDAETVMACTLAFCQAMEQQGRQPMVYFNPHMTKKYVRLEDLKQYPFWLAMYSDQMTFPYRVDMWQYTDSGSVPGIQGKVDIDLFFPY